MYIYVYISYRYKVRVEISAKQKSADLSPSPQPSSLTHKKLNNTTTSNTSESTYPSSTLPTSSSAEQLSELTKWIQAYEKLARENETLRTQSGDALLVKKLQQRCEEMLREKEDLQAKLKLFTRINETQTKLIGTGGGSGGSGQVNGTTNGQGSARKTLEQTYIELKDEHKDYRRRTEALLLQRKSEIAELRAVLEDHGLLDTAHSTGALSSGGYGGYGRHATSSLGSHSHDPSSHPGGHDGQSHQQAPSFADSKVTYIRSMFLQYLTCKDPVVKPHIESALIAIFR